MKVYITRKIPEPGLELFRKAGIDYSEWTEKRELTTDELYAACKDHDALLSVGPNKINEDFFSNCSHLKVVSLHAVGFDNVDVHAATRYKIPIGNTPGVLSAATADTAFLLMLAASRKAFYLSKTIAKGEWGFFEPLKDLGIELHGKTVGIFGLGKIGEEFAKRCIGAYNMRLIYHNRKPNQAAEEQLGARLVDFDHLLKESDVLSVHAALTPETKGIFNAASFAKMKHTSIFINAARGGIHDEVALKDALDKGVIWGAGLDVTNPEPMSATNPLLDMPNVAILPHIGSATIEARNEMSRLAAENVIAGITGKRLPHVVNPEVYLEK